MDVDDAMSRNDVAWPKGTRMLPRWAGWAGLVASGLYLLNQGDILATAVPGFPVWDLAGLLGSSMWGVWVMALGVVVLRRRPSSTPAAHPVTATPSIPSYIGAEIS
jgi:hypothetical protein